MKILLLNNRVPFPLRDGGAAATFGLIKNLRTQNVDLQLFFLNTKKHFVENKIIKEQFTENSIVKFLDTSVSIFGAIKSALKGSSYNLDRFYNKDIANEIAILCKQSQFDVVHFENLFMAPYLDIVRENTKAKCVLRMHNVEFKIWEKLSIEEKNPVKKIYLKYLTSQLKKFELQAVQKFDALIPISKADMHWAQQNCNTICHYLPVGFDIEQKPKIKFGNKFFHIGSMEWQPNQKACDFLVNQIWPIVNNKNPKLELHLAGKGMGETYKKWESSSIFIHGEVENAGHFMQANNVLCIPLQSASGVRIKALEAMANGNPVISTSIGMSGIDFISNQNCIIADDKEEFAKAILTIADNKEQYQMIANNAFAYVNSEFDNQHIIQHLITFYNQLNQIN